MDPRIDPVMLNWFRFHPATTITGSAVLAIAASAAWAMSGLPSSSAWQP